MRHLAQLGHRRVAYTSPPTNSHGWSVSNRRTAAMTMAQELGMTLHLHPSYDVVTASDRVLDQVLADGDTAIITYCSFEVHPLRHAAAQRGLRIPEHVSLVSADDGDGDALNSYATTCVSLPRNEMADALIDLLEGRFTAPAQPPRQITVRESLCVRSSTAAPCGQPLPVIGAALSGTRRQPMDMACFSFPS
jgi:DNA-binding LacI/PurR family transcriptional regulator